MPQVVNNQNLNGFQVTNARGHVLAAAPGAPTVGLHYYDSVALRNLWWNGTAWTADATHLNGNTAAFYLARANHSGTQLSATISDLAAVVKAYRLDEFAAPTAAVSLGSQRITSLAAPVGGTDAANKAYVDATAQGLVIKAAVRVTSDVNTTVVYLATGGTSARGQITAAPNVLDGVNLAVNDRILLKSQTAGAQNGVWVVTTVGAGATGVWDRATDYDQDSEVRPGSFTFVSEGTAPRANSSWVLTNDDPIVIGGASGSVLVYAQFGAASSVVGGAGLTLTGNTLDVIGGTGITVAADLVSIDTSVVSRKNAATLATSAVSYTVAHGAGNADVVVRVRETTSGIYVEPDITVDATNITIAFGTAPAANFYRVMWTF